jgi:ketol-acid reductoisomerase
MEMWNSVSDTAEYGGLTRGPEIIGDDVRENMEETLEAVQSGTFAREWITENQAGRPVYTQHRNAEQNHEIEDVGERLRALFSWAEEEDAEAESEEAEEDEEKVGLRG